MTTVVKMVMMVAAMVLPLAHTSVATAVTGNVLIAYIEDDEQDAAIQAIDANREFVHWINPNGREGNTTLLHYAASYGRIKVVEFLIQLGADVNHAMADTKRVPLHIVIEGHDPIEFATLLIEAGADVNVQDASGDTALMRSIGYPEIDMMKLLVNHSADLHITNNEGQAALHMMLAPEQTNVLTYFLTLCPNMTIQDNNGKTALDIAVDENYAESQTLLSRKMNEPCTMNNMTYGLGATLYQDCTEIVCATNCSWEATGNDDPACTTTAPAPAPAPAPVPVLLGNGGGSKDVVVVVNQEVNSG